MSTSLNPTVEEVLDYEGDATMDGTQPPLPGGASNPQHAGAQNPADQDASKGGKGYDKDAYMAARRVNELPDKDYYGYLALQPSCTPSEIKSSYRRLAILTHPDKNKYKGAKGAFQSSYSIRSRTGANTGQRDLAGVSSTKRPPREGEVRQAEEK